MRPDWNEYFMVIAKIISTRSTCNSRPTGAVIVKDKQILSTGYNGSMPGAPHCSDEPPIDGKPFCFRRSMKAPEDDKYNYCRSSHAEANAVSRAARLGIALDGSTLFVTLSPCYVCLKQLANAGVRHIYYEFDYESTKKERDEFWKKIISESPIETFEQLYVSKETINQIISSLEYPTSRRRLPENYQFYSNHKVSVADITRSAEETNYKKAILDSLTGNVDGDRIYGEPLEIGMQAPTDTKLRGSRRKAALAFLSSLEIMTDDLMGSSEALKGLLNEIILDQNKSQTVSSSKFNITASLSDNRLDVSFKLTSADLLMEFQTITDSTVLIYHELFENIIDHFDISLERGSAITAIKRPYIKVSDKELVKKILTRQIITI